MAILALSLEKYRVLVPQLETAQIWADIMVASRKQGRPMSLQDTYLPDYLLKRMDVLTLKISGCPYECRQEIRLIAKNPKNVNWMNLFF